MQPHEHDPSPLRFLLESSGTPFTVARYPQRAALFSQGQACDSVMYLEQGRVWLAVTTPAGKEAICGISAAGAFLGEEVLGGNAVRRQTAIAMTATEVLVVAKAHFNRLIRTKPEAMDLFMAHILARNARLETDLTDQLLYSTERRLAHALILLAGCDVHRPSRCVLPDIPQEIISEMVGTTRSRVNVFMGRFKKQGFIDESGGVLHVNPAKLHVGEPVIGGGSSLVPS